MCSSDLRRNPCVAQESKLATPKKKSASAGLSVRIPGTREILIDKLDPKGWRNIPAGFRIYRLWEHPKTHASISLFEIPKGVGVPTRHIHASNQFMYCLKGEYEYLSNGLVLKPGAFYMNPQGHPHGPTIARKDSLLIEMYDGPHYFEVPSYHTKDTVGSVAGGVKKKTKKPAKKKAKNAANSGSVRATRKSAKKAPSRAAAKKKPGSGRG